ncbi:MAG: DsbE family thiol:disulfide interchange protein [Rhodospirillales bacterium]|nr:MAG: DsbE family thiol:disulfide interchange protein [Rhodospirillales bacterium]
MRRLTFILPLVIFAGFVGATGWYIIEIQRDSQRAPNIINAGEQNKPVPEFDLPPLMDGIPGFATGDFGSQVVMVNVFASWCIPCRAEHPLITRIGEDGIVPVWGINYKNKREEAIAWLEDLGNSYERIGFDLSGRVGIEWGVYGVPETFLVDRNGRIRYKHVGPLTRSDLNETILPMIECLNTTPQVTECLSGS